MPVSVVAAFFLIWAIALAPHWFANTFQTSFPDASSESLFFGLGFYGNILMAIAAIGAPLAIWRSLALQKQSEVAQGSLLADRYRTGVEMLGSKVLPVRHGGIHILERVAESDPFTYHIPTMSVLSIFIRDASGTDERDGKQDNTVVDDEQEEPPLDVRTVLEVIGRRSSKQRKIESERKYMVNLRGICLRGWRPDAPTLGPYPDFSNVDFAYADLSKVVLSLLKCSNSQFSGTNLSSARLVHTDLSGAFFIGADLSGTCLAHANLASASFHQAILSETDLKKAKGLTQEQINSARIDAKHPPVLTEAVDAKTKRPLIVPLQ